MTKFSAILFVNTKGEKRKKKQQKKKTKRTGNRTHLICACVFSCLYKKQIKTEKNRNMKSANKILCLVNLPNGTTFGIQCDPKAIGQKCLEEVMIIILNYKFLYKLNEKLHLHKKYVYENLYFWLKRLFVICSYIFFLLQQNLCTSTIRNSIFFGGQLFDDISLNTLL